MTEPTDAPEPSTPAMSRGERRAARAAQRTRVVTPGRTVVVAVIVVLVVAAIVAQLFTTGREDAAVVPVPVDGVASARSADTAWYCAEGTSNPNGRADETIIIGNIGDERALATVAVDVAGVTKTKELTVEPQRQQRVKVSEIVAAPDPGVAVYGAGGQLVVEHQVVGAGDAAIGPCARRASSTWYFAGGSTVKGSFEWLSLYNPFPDGDQVDVEVLTRNITGETAVDRVERIASANVPGRTKIAVPIHDKIGRFTQTAIVVRTRYGRVVAERSIVYDNVEGRKGLAVSLGTPELSRSWVFPEGRTAEGRAEVLAVANPSAVTAEVEIASLFEGGITVEPARISIPPRTVTDVPLPGSPKDVVRGSVLTSSEPVVAELRVATGRPAVPGLATTLGEVEPYRRWAFAAATLDAASTDSYRIINRNDETATVRVTFVGAANPDGPEIEVPANAIITFETAKTAATPNVVLEFTADRPVYIGRVSSNPGVTVSPGLPVR